MSAEVIHCAACGTDGLTHATFMAHARVCEKHPLTEALRFVAVRMVLLELALERAVTRCSACGTCGPAHCPDCAAARSLLASKGVTP